MKLLSAALILGKFEIAGRDGDDASAAMLRLIDRLAERVEASTTDRQADDVHILCIDDVVARASDIFELGIPLIRLEREQGCVDSG